MEDNNSIPEQPAHIVVQAGQNQSPEKKGRFVKLRALGILTIVLFFTIGAGAWFLTKNSVQADEIEVLTNQLVKDKAQKKPKTELEIKKMVDTAKKRQELLLEKAKTDPKAFIEKANLTQSREEFPEETKPYIEKSARLSGQLTIVHEDDFENKKATYEYFLSDNIDRRSPFSAKYKLHFTKDAPQLLTGSEITTEGIELDKNVAVTNFKINSSATQSFSSGEQKTLVILAQLNNYTNPYTIDQIRSLMFGTSTQSVNEYYKENSLGKVSFSGDVVGWYSIPLTSNNCAQQTWANEADSMAISKGINLSNYNRIVYVVYGAPCGTIAGMSTLGGYPSRAWIFFPDRYITYLHEIGHSLGNNHASTLNCYPNQIDEDSKCKYEEYGDGYDTMGYGSSNHFNAPHKVAMGWPNVREVTDDGVYTLSPLETASVGSGPQVLTIRKPGSTYEHYFVSYRQKIGYDSSLPNYLVEGVTVHTWGWISQTKFLDTSPTVDAGGSFYDAALYDGVAFYDQINRIMVKQLSHTLSTSTTPGSATVEVKFLPTPTPTPTATPLPSGSTLPSSSDYRRVFLTSTTYNGNLGGLSGADQKCTDQANAASLGGIWKAWLSDSTISAASRLNQASVPYKLLNGTTIANNWDDLTDGSLLAPINLDENKTTKSPDTGVWTNTTTSGNLIVGNFLPEKPEHCNNWTFSSPPTSTNPYQGQFGLYDRSNSAWTFMWPTYCDRNDRLYCFEQNSSSVSPTPAPSPTPNSIPLPSPRPMPTPSPKPDLVIESVIPVNQPIVGVTSDVDAAIKNVGQASVESSIPIEVAVIIRKPGQAVGSVNCKGTFNSLAKDAGLVVQVRNCPIFDQIGDHNVSAMVDFNRIIGEDDIGGETNNTFSTILTVTPSPAPTPTLSPTSSPTPTPSPTPSPTSESTLSPTPTPSPTPRAIGYALAETSAELDSIQEPTTRVEFFPVTIDYTFRNSDPGNKVLFVKFFYSDGTSQVKFSSLIYRPQTPSPSPSGSPSPAPTPSPEPTLTPDPTPTPSPTLPPSPSPSPAPIPGDANGDGVVDIVDYSILQGEFGKHEPPELRADFNNDGQVDIVDYSILVKNFGKRS